MKTKTKLQQKFRSRPLHLHVEYFFRLRVCLLIAGGLLTLAFAKAERDVLAAMPSAYAEGAGVIGSYMSEERIHPHHTLHVLRVPTTSSR